jgi:hypothetical protein
VVLVLSAESPVAVFSLPVMTRFPALIPAKKLPLPKVCIRRFDPDFMIPVVEVVAGRLRLPETVTSPWID